MVSNLRGNIEVTDVVLKVAHEHKVTSMVPIVDEGLVVDMTKHGTGADAIRNFLTVQKLAFRCNELAQLRLNLIVNDDTARSVLGSLNGLFALFCFWVDVVPRW